MSNYRNYKNDTYQKKDARGGSAFSWFLAGLGVGSLFGVLYAPKSGQETREELIAGALGSGEYVRQRSRQATYVAGDYVERGKGQVDQYVSRGRGQVDRYVSRGKDAVETGRQKINQAYNQGRYAITEQKEKLNAAYDAGKQAYEETSAPPVQHEELIQNGEHLG